MATVRERYEITQDGLDSSGLTRAEMGALVDEMVKRWQPALDLLGDKTCRDDACPPCSEKRRREREEP